MRLLFVGFFCLLCGGAFAAQPAVPTTSYVNDAGNLTTGTVAIERLPVGSGAGTVASGADVRFDTVSIGQPGEGSTGRALVWIEE